MKNLALSGVLAVAITITFFGYMAADISHSLHIIASPPSTTISTSVDAKVLQIGDDVQLKFRDYQLEVVEDTILVYDLNRLVGKLPLDYTDSPDELSNLLLEDNQ